ncbi:TPA: hypothetical protein ACRNDK_002655 [Pseudomonas aeruginosa]
MSNIQNRKKQISQYTLQELLKRIEDVCLSLKNQGLKSKIKQAASLAFDELNISALRSLLIVALAAQTDEELFVEKVEKEGLVYDQLSKEFLSEIDSSKSISDMSNTIDEVSKQLKMNTQFNKPKI